MKETQLFEKEGILDLGKCEVGGAQKRGKRKLSGFWRRGDSISRSPTVTNVPTTKT